MLKDYVSVMVPSFNNEKFLLDFLNSISSQSYKKIQLIFINDGSSDNTELVFKDWKQTINNNNYLVVQYFKIKHSGQSVAINKALKYVDGEYIMWCDSDDVLHKDNVYEKVDFLKNNQDYDMVRHNALKIDANLNKELDLYFNDYYNAEVPLFDAFFTGKIIQSGVAIYLTRTSFFNKIFTNNQIINSEVGQNFQLMLPLLSYGKCGYIDKVLYYYRIHDDGHANRKRSIKEIIDRIDKIANLLIDIVPLCNCNQEKYLDLIENYRKIEKQKYLKLAILNARNK